MNSAAQTIEQLEAQETARTIGRRLAESGRTKWKPGIQPPPGFWEALVIELGRECREDERTSAVEGWCEEAIGFGYGQGTISRTTSGQFRVRLPDGVGGQKSLPLYASWSMANAVRLESLRQLADTNLVPSGKMTLRALGERYLVLKDKRRPRSAPTYRMRWDTHICPLPDRVTKQRPGFEGADWPIDAIEHDHIEKFVSQLQGAQVDGDGGKPKRMEPSYVQGLFGELRSVLRYAVAHGYIARNPCDAQDLPEVKKKSQLEKDLEWLDLEEQEAVLYCPLIPEDDRILIGCTIGFGCRVQEMIWMPRVDLEQAVKTGILPVAHNENNQDPKNGTRQVPLVEMGRAYAARWLERLNSYCRKNPLALAFPTKKGCHRSRSKFLGDRLGKNRWHYYRELAGVKKPVKWHGLRKTCGSSLYNGLWGDEYSPQAAAEYIGDTVEVFLSSYGRISQKALLRRARTTSGGPLPKQDQNKTAEAPPHAQKAAKQAVPVMPVRSTRTSKELVAHSGGYVDPVLLAVLSRETQDIRQTLSKPHRRLSRLQKASFLRVADEVLAAFCPALATRQSAGEEGPFQEVELLKLARELEALAASLAVLVKKKSGGAA